MFSRRSDSERKLMTATSEMQVADMAGAAVVANYERIHESAETGRENLRCGLSPAQGRKPTGRANGLGESLTLRRFEGGGGKRHFPHRTQTVAASACGQKVLAAVPAPSQRAVACSAVHWSSS